MGLCNDAGIPTFLLVGGTVGGVVFFLTLSGGIDMVGTAAIAGLVVGGAAGALYALNSCHFNIAECTAAGVFGGAKDVVCSVI